MRTWSVYELESGLLTGLQFTAPDVAVEKNTPPGCGVVEGAHDHLSKRVDLATGNIVDYQPPKPDDDHEWDVTTDPSRPRWRKRPDVVAREERRAIRMARIEWLERKQHRPLRELQLDPASTEARQRLDQIDQEIARLRSELNE